MKLSFRPKKFLMHLTLLLASILMIYPIFWWVGAAFKPDSELSSPGIWPHHFTIQNFTNGWNGIPGQSFTNFYLNTFELLASVLFTTVISCSLVAFGFARLDFPLKKMWFAIVMVTLMLPGQVTIVPQYVMFHAFGWVDTYLPFIVPHALAAGIGGPFFIFLLVQFIRGIPRDLDESAKIDGASWFGVYWRIILPLLKPPLVTVAIYCFLWNWDDFLGQLIYINSIDKYTIGLALKMFVDANSATPWGQLFAMSLVSIIPAIILFFVAQKHIVEGIANTGIKG